MHVNYIYAQHKFWLNKLVMFSSSWSNGECPVQDHAEVH